MENTNDKPSPSPPPRTPQRHPLPSGRSQGSDQDPHERRAYTDSGGDRSRERHAYTDSGGDRQRHGEAESTSGSERKRNWSGYEADVSKKRRTAEFLREYGQATPSRRETMSTGVAKAAEGN